MAAILIPAPRIPVIDPKTGMMATAWYAFFAQFLQGLSNGAGTTAVDLAALTSRVLAAENDVDALAAADGSLFVDHAMAAPPTAEIDALRKRVTDLELQISLMVPPGAAVDELRKRVSDLETDFEIRT